MDVRASPGLSCRATKKPEGFVTYRWSNRIDEAENTIERHLIVHRDDLESMGLYCCLGADDRDRLVELGGDSAEKILADGAYIPDAHWTSHGVQDLPSGPSLK